MNDPKDPVGPPQAPDHDATIFNPQGPGAVPVPPAAAPEEEAASNEAHPEPPASPSPWGEPEPEPEPGPEATDADDPAPQTTQAAESWGETPEPEPEPVPLTRPPSATISAIQNAPINPQPHAQGIKVGDVLNHIFEVTRFIARGGMGEVFEAVNVNSDEKVAVKVMLPSLAADPNIIQMFRREARTMTRLHHEALVQYRVLAQEPQLGVLYIVTEYIDGVPLGDVLGTLKPNADDLEMLLRRLAAGLAAAHRLGALHRDMSPDNVLLEGGRLSSAKVIDFGIAKDLNPGTATIIGDGFAGKLGYVAPEQLGDFGRELGPWTDVYSLGLVILAVAMGKDVAMGGTLVDAVDKRRNGPDLSMVPERVRPVLAGMLTANPANRLRSMEEVLTALDETHAPPPPVVAETTGGGQSSKRNLIIGGAAGLLLLAGLGTWLASGSDDPTATGGQTAAGGAGAPAARPGNPVESARQAINSAIPSIGCSWLDIVQIEGAKGQISVAMGGVAGSPAAAQSEIAGALSSAGQANANIDFSSVAPIQPGGCAAIDAYRQMRNSEAPRLATDQRKWEIKKADDSKLGGEVARLIIRISDPGPGEDLTLFGIEPSGQFGELINSRGDFDAAASSAESGVTKRAGAGYEIQSDLDHQGWSGLILLTGKGPFDPALLRPDLGARNVAWRQKLVDAASERGWKADMLWVKTVNERAGD